MSDSRAALIQRAAELIERGDRQKLVFPQDTGFLSLDADRIGGIKRLLNETTDFLSQVMELFEGSDVDEDGELPDDRRGVTLQPQEVSDLAFICRGELRQLGAELEQAEANKNIWKIAAEGDRAVARAIRAVIPLEAAMREYAGETSLQRRWFDLEDALEIRRRYLDLWLEAKRDGVPPVANRNSRFQVVLDKIAHLRKDRIYAYLRIDDRLQVRSLQKRIAIQIAGTPAGATPSADSAVDGERLWQDMAGFFDLLMHINRREELIEHDRQQVGQVFRQIYDLSTAPEIMPAELKRQLMHVLSQDPALDQLLMQDAPTRTADYREPLARLRERMASGGFGR